jgi:hypothetical protein
MIRLPFFAAALAGIILWQLPASAATPQQELQSRQFLIGTWNCTFTAGPSKGRYTTTWSYVLDNRWLKQTYDQAAQPKAQPFRAEYFVGFDEARKAWVRFGAMTTGQYFAIRMNDAGDGNWAWRYVSFFGRRSGNSAKPDATFTKKSESQYTVDGPTYPGENGKMETEHHICRKAA